MSGPSRFSGGWCRVGPGLIARNIGLPLQVATLALVIRALRHGSRRTIGVAATAVAALALLHLMRFTGARPPTRWGSCSRWRTFGPRRRRRPSQPDLVATHRRAA